MGELGKLITNPAYSSYYTRLQREEVTRTGDIKIDTQKIELKEDCQRTGLTYKIHELSESLKS